MPKKAQTQNEVQQSKTLVYVSLIVISILTIVVCIPSVFEWFRLSSLDLIILIRRDFAHEKIDKLVDMTSALGDKYGVFLCLCLAVALLDMNNYLSLIGVSTFGVAVNLLVKMMIRDERPYFYSTDYQPVSCNFEYGSPSGHGQTVTTFHLSFLTVFIRQYGIKNRKFLLYVAGYAFCIFMCFTRIWVGLHTAEQLLLGFGLGMIIHIIFLHVLDGYFDKLYQGIETGKTRLFNRFIILHCIMAVAAIFMYDYIGKYDPAPEEWINSVKRACPHEKKFISFEYSCLFKYLVAFGSMGAYFGCYFRRWVLKSKDGSKFKKPSSFFKALIRIVINIIAFALLSLPAALASRKSPVPLQLLVKGFIVPFLTTAVSMLYINPVIRMLNI
ncbi:unnamed protein product [Moneuplotes crassus]|uniref:Phosphatidic acid phosphatase type 2/haloperoxidase domain-containing protein n=1 Tax=Euplotes crassus TaxID=5936 RepID=A0AAD1XHW7_EUPCR|nr:unnamed protein product [Moneuplotes crassus]